VLTTEIGKDVAAKRDRRRQKAIEIHGIDHRKLRCLQSLSGWALPPMFSFLPSTKPSHGIWQHVINSYFEPLCIIAGKVINLHEFVMKESLCPLSINRRSPLRHQLSILLNIMPSGRLPNGGIIALGIIARSSDILKIDTRNVTRGRFSFIKHR
jgi:hypothetical protein